jgi:iron complex outermembrane receptor protein
MISSLILSVLMLTIVVPPDGTMEGDASSNSYTAGTEAKSLPVVQVRSRRYETVSTQNTSLSVLSEDEILVVKPRHPNQLFNRVAGAWVSNGSGQEHLTAIRSPVLTGAGACAAFMVVEDDVPTRPSGFCNVNQLFEVNISQANRIDVLRGPGTVIYGSNALHGAINIFTPGPDSLPFGEFAVEAGTDAYYRGSIEMSGAHSALQASYTDSGSFRDAESYQHGLLNLQFDHNIEQIQGRTSFAYAYLEQQTAGYILGKNSYKNEYLRTKNLNPDAFRNAYALRLSSRWDWLSKTGSEFEIIPFIRISRMDFLQHFLPGTPLENNGQDSAGLLFTWSANENLSTGIDLEWANGELLEYQEQPIESGSDFLKETRPQGYHYDYSAKAISLAGWMQWQGNVSDHVRINAGLRAEHLSYDYSNRMLSGNTRDDGTECGLEVVCIHARPIEVTISPVFHRNLG